jgi:hypothetical protein
MAAPPAKHVLDPHPFPELVFALIGPTGADIPIFTLGALRNELTSLGYRVQDIRISKLIEKFFGKDYSTVYDDERVENLMSDGTRLRELTGRGDEAARSAKSAK